MTTMGQVAAPPVTAVRNPSLVAGVIALVAAGVTVLGSLLPWATLTTAFGSINVAGTSGDGVVTLLLGLAAGGLTAVAVWVTPHRIWPVLAAVAGLAALIVSGLDYSDITGRVADANAAGDGYASASVGGGLILTLLGSVGVTVGAVLVAARARFTRTGT